MPKNKKSFIPKPVSPKTANSKNPLLDAMLNPNFVKREEEKNRELREANRQAELAKIKAEAEKNKFKKAENRAKNFAIEQNFEELTKNKEVAKQNIDYITNLKKKGKISSEHEQVLKDSENFLQEVADFEKQNKSEVPFNKTKYNFLTGKKEDLKPEHFISPELNKLKYNIEQDKKKKIDEIKAKNKEFVEKNFVAPIGTSKEEADKLKENEVERLSALEISNQIGEALSKDHIAQKADKALQRFAKVNSANIIERGIIQDIEGTTDIRSELERQTDQFFDAKERIEELKAKRYVDKVGKQHIARMKERIDALGLETSENESGIVSLGKGLLTLGVSATNLAHTLFWKAPKTIFEDSGLTQEEKEELQRLYSLINEKEVPEMQKQLKTLEEEFAKLKETLQPGTYSPGSREGRKLAAIGKSIQALKKELSVRQGERYNSWTGIGQFITDMYESGSDWGMSVINAIDNGRIGRKIKKEGINSLTEEEREYYEVMQEFQELKDLPSQNIWLQGAKDVRHSLNFIAELAITSRITGGLSTKAVDALSKILRGSSNLSPLTVKAIEKGIKVANSGKNIDKNVLAQTALQPSTYLNFLSSSLDNIQSVEDIYGDMHFASTNEERRLLGEELGKDVSELKNIINKYQGIDENLLSPEELDLYNEAKEWLPHAEQVYRQVINPDGSLVSASQSDMREFMKSFNENLNENIEERIIGAKIDKISGQLGKRLLGEASKPTAIRKATRFVYRPIKKANDFQKFLRKNANDVLTKNKAYRNTTNFLNNSSLKAVVPSKEGIRDYIQSPVGEIGEEFFGSFLPSVDENAEVHGDFVAWGELATLQSVAISTLAMQTMMLPLGAGNHIIRMKDKKYRDNYNRTRRIAKTYEAISFAMGDKELQRAIGMMTPGQEYNPEEIRREIAAVKDKTNATYAHLTDKQREQMVEDLEANLNENIIMEAFKTGTVDDLIEALETAENYNTKDENASKRINELLATVKEYQDYVNKNKGRINSGEVTETQIQLSNTEKRLQKLLKRQSEHLEENKEYIEKRVEEFNKERRKEGKEEISIDDLFVNTASTDIENSLSESQATKMANLADFVAFEAKKHGMEITPLTEKSTKQEEKKYLEQQMKLAEVSPVLTALGFSEIVSEINLTKKKLNEILEFELNPANREKIQNREKAKTLFRVHTLIQDNPNEITEEQQNDIINHLKENGITEPEVIEAIKKSIYNKNNPKKKIEEQDASVLEKEDIDLMADTVDAVANKTKESERVERDTLEARVNTEKEHQEFKGENTVEVQQPTSAQSNAETQKADIERGRKPLNKGLERITNILAGKKEIETEKQAVDILNEIYRFRKNHRRRSLATKEELTLMDKLEQEAKEKFGLEIVPYIGKEYDERINIDVIEFEQKQDGEGDKSIIIAERRPQINKNGVLVQRAQVDVLQGLSQKQYDAELADLEAQPPSQQKQQAQQLYSQYLEQNPNGSVEQFKSWLDNNQSDVQYQLPQGREIEEFVASEKTIRDLAARMSDRIGIPVRFESDRTKEYKGKLENGTAVINLAYATLDTPIHEILGHPIIRAIKNRDKILSYDEWVKINTTPEMQGLDIDISKEAYDKYVNWRNNTSKLYQNLLKELEYGKGKEILGRVKRDYQIKSKPEIIELESMVSGENTYEVLGKEFNNKEDAVKYQQEQTKYYTLEEQQEEAIVELLGLYTAGRLDKVKDGKLISLLKRLLKEMKAFMRSLIGQKEVEIDKLPDNMTLGDIADLLAYSNSKLILPGNEVVYTTPDNQQFKTYAEASKHISQLAKSVEDVNLSDVILNLTPNFLETVSGFIIEKDSKGYFFNLKSIKPTKTLKDAYFNTDFLIDNYNYPVEYLTKEEFEKETNEKVVGNPVINKIIGNYVYEHSVGIDFIGTEDTFYRVPVKHYISEELYKKIEREDNRFTKGDIPDEYGGGTYDLDTPITPLKNFIEKNKQYEQSKEIIEEWKKVNNIQYNPEEVYSRGQEFVSVVGAYSDFDVNLMMQNLLQHIEDNQKAGGEFTISAFTKPVDRKINHLEGGGGKIKFKIYPQSQDIKWAANTDVYSGSVWDASEKVNKDKKSELLGVSYTKYPSLDNIHTIQPNLAAIIDNLAHYHNELGISLTGNNFRLEYDEDIPYSTKKIIDSINSILDQKYGKLVKPEIKDKSKNKEVTLKEVYENIKNDNYEYSYQDDKYFNILVDEFNLDNNQDYYELKSELLGRIEEILKVNPDVILESGAKQPTQTKETLKESIEDVKNKIGVLLPNILLDKSEFTSITEEEYLDAINKGKISNTNIGTKQFGYSETYEYNGYIYTQIDFEELGKIKIKEKEYYEQALINLKIARLKEVAKKYPRSLIRSEVRPISSSSNLGFTEDELPFQKVSDSSFSQFQQSLNKPNTNPILQSNQQEQAKKFAELQERLNNEEFLEGAKNAFESSEELQNVYYEASGIGKFRVTLGKELNPEQKFGSQGEPVVKKFEVLDEHKKVIGTVVLDIAKDGSITAHPTLTTIGKGYGQELYQIISLTFGAPIIEWGPHNMSKSPEGKKLWNSLEKKGLAKAKYQWDDDLYLRGIDLSQQKQDALNAYTDYIARVSLGIIKNPSSGEYNYESEVRDIVYHGTKNKFDEFKVKDLTNSTINKTSGAFFSPDAEFASRYGNVLNNIISIKNPLIVNRDNRQEIQHKLLEEGLVLNQDYTFTDKSINLTQYSDSFIKYLQNKGFDGVIVDLDSIDYLQQLGIEGDYSSFQHLEYALTLPKNKQKEYLSNSGVTSNVASSEQILRDFKRIYKIGSGNPIEYVVFEPEQIHILGGKQDVEGFKGFVSNENNAKYDAEYVEAVKKSIYNKNNPKKKIEEQDVDVPAITAVTEESEETEKPKKTDGTDIAFVPKSREDFIEEEYQNMVTNMSELLISALQKNPTLTFEGLVQSLFGSPTFGSQKLDTNYNAIVDAWNVAKEAIDKDNGVTNPNKDITPQQASEIYNKFFLPEDVVADLGRAVSAQPATKEKPIADNSAEVTVTSSEITDQEIQEVQELEAEDKGDLIPAPYQKNLYADVGLKFGGFTGKKYTVVDGKYVSMTDDINPQAAAFLDPTNFYEGESIDLVFDIDYLLDENATFRYWDNLETDSTFVDGQRLAPSTVQSTVGKVLTKITGESWEKIAGDLREFQRTGKVSPSSVLNNEELLKVLPVGIPNQNNQRSIQSPDGIGHNREILIGGIPEYHWFNSSNVALKGRMVDGKFVPDYAEYNRRLKANQEQNLNLRRQMLKNGGKATVRVKERTPGKLNTTHENKNPNNNPHRFNSLLDMFGDSFEFDSFATIGYINAEGNVISSFGINAEIENKKGFIDRARKDNMVSGRTVLIYKSGQRKNKDGSITPIYSMMDVNNIHENRQEEMKRQAEIYSSVLQMYNSLPASEKDKFNTNFELLYGMPFAEKGKNAGKSGASSILSDIYPKSTTLSKKQKEQYELKLATDKRNLERLQKQRENSSKHLSPTEKSVLDSNIEKLEKSVSQIEDLIQREGIYKQFFNREAYANTKLKEIPNLANISSAEEFISTILKGDVSASLPTTSIKNAVLSNLHTSSIFSKVSKLENGKIVYNYTNEVQPNILLENVDVEITQQEKVDLEIAKNYLEKRRERVIENMREAKDSAKEKLNTELENINAQLLDIDKKLGLEIKNLATSVDSSSKALSEVENTPEFSEADLFAIISTVVAEALSIVPLSNNINIGKIYSKAEESVDNLIATWRSQGLNVEADFLEKNRGKVLGYDTNTGRSFYEGSVREYINVELGISQSQINQINRQLGENIKNYDAVSFEVNPVETLSAIVKSQMIGIPDTSSEALIGGLYPMMSADTALKVVSDVMSSINNNTFEELKKEIEKRVNTNPKDLKYYQDILNRLEKIQEHSPHLINQLLYRLYQPKVSMKLALWHKDKKGRLYVEVLDANARDPKIAKRALWTENMKVSGLLELYGGNKFRVNIDNLYKVQDLYEAIKKELESDNPTLSNVKREIRDILELTGISVSNLTFDTIVNGDGILNGYDAKTNLFVGGNSIISNILDNLNLIVSSSNNEYTLSNDVDGALKLNPLVNNNSKLNEFIKADNETEFALSSTMYVAGKTINTTQQPNQISNQIAKIKNALKEFEKTGSIVGTELERLLNTPSLRNSFLLNSLLSTVEQEMVKKHETGNVSNHTTEFFNSFLASLETFKKRKAKSRDDKGPTSLSSDEKLVALLSFAFHSEENNIENNWANEYGSGITMRKSYMNFPTLSDASQMPFLQTLLLNITNELIDTQTGKMNGTLTDLMIDQLVASDMHRIIDYVVKVRNEGQTSNTQFYDNIVTLFGNIPSLNTKLLNGEPLINVFIRHINSEIEIKNISPSELTSEDATEIINSFIENTQNKEAIKSEIEGHLNSEVSKTMQMFKDLRAIDRTNGELKINVGTLNGKDAKLAAYDFAINTFLQQKDIQLVFAGDLAYYGKSSTMTKSEHIGEIPEITIEDVFNYHYGNDSNAEQRFRQIVGDSSIKNLPEDKRKALIKAFEHLGEHPSLNSDKELFSEALQPVYTAKVNQVFEEVRNNLSKRLKGILSPGNKLVGSSNTENNTYVQLMVNDIENASVAFVSHYINTFYPDALSNTKLMDITNKYLEIDTKYPNERTQEEKEWLKTKGENGLTPKKTIETAFPLIAPFLETASTDAQEYTTWREHLQYLERRGSLSREDVAYFTERLSEQDKFLRENKNTPLPQELKLSREESKRLLGQPVKPLYFGLIDTEIGEGHKTRIPVYIKSSSFPLLPEFTSGMPGGKLESLRQNVEDYEEATKYNEKGEEQQGKTVRISYQSANKVGAVKDAIDINELYEDYGQNKDVLFTKINNSSVELHRDSFSIQQDVPYEHDLNVEEGKSDRSTRMTQFEKIILGDGISQITEKVFDATSFDSTILSDLGIEVVNDKISGKDLQELYKELYKREQAEVQRRLFNELGISTPNDLARRDVSVMRNLQRFLNKKLDKKQDSKAIELVFEVEHNGVTMFVEEHELQANPSYKVVSAQFRFPLFMMPNSQKMESVLSSLITNNSVKLDMPGHHFIVGSQEGMSLRATEFNEEDFKGTNLIFTDKFDPKKGLLPNQVFMPNKFTYYDVEVGAEVEMDFTEYMIEGTNIIDTSKLPKEVLKMFSMRVPTSAHQSGINIEVVGFLPDSMNDLLIVSKDATIQIGEDYDIDHRYGYDFNFIRTEDGTIKKLDYEDIEYYDVITEIGKLKLSDAKNMVLEDYKNAKTNIHASFKNNPLYEANREVFIEITELMSLAKKGRISKAIAEKYDIPYARKQKEVREIIIEKINSLEEKIIRPEIVSQRARELKREKQLILSELRRRFENDIDSIRTLWEKNINLAEALTQETKVLENNLSAMYQSVFSSEDTQVKKLISRVLSTEFSERAADAIDNKLNRDKDSHYNIFSYHTQDKVMKTGAVGKIGIGSHSNAVVFNSILQQLDNKMKIDIRDKPLKFGKLTWDGVLGRTENQLGKSTSTYLMESQNSATDNQKLEIMARRNETPETMAVLALMQMAGLEQDGILIKRGIEDNVGKEYSYASLFISQPVLIEFVEAVAKYNSSLSSEFGNAIELAFSKIDAKYRFSDKAVKKQVSLDTVSESVTSQKLFDMIGQDINDINNYHAQRFIFARFKRLYTIAKAIRELQKLVNIEADGLGVSFFDTISLKDNLLDFMGSSSNNSSDGLQSLFGFTTESDSSLFEEMIGERLVVGSSDTTSIPQNIEDYIYVASRGGRDYYIKPTTHYGHKIVNSISTSYNLWKNVFPFDENTIKKSLFHIAYSLDVDLSTRAGEDLKYKVLGAMKDYMYSNVPSLFDGNVSGYTNKIFFNSKENESLASYISRLKAMKNENGESVYKSLFSLPFFSKLSFEINDETRPSLILYSRAKESPSENVFAYNTLATLVNNTEALPDRSDGSKMTYETLMKELLMYSLLADQENGAIGFRTELPVELFSKYGVDKYMRNRSDMTNADVQLAISGPTIQLENYFGGFFHEGVLQTNASTEEIQSFVDEINKYTISKGVGEVFKVLEGGKIVNTLQGVTDKNMSFFVKQFLQHNTEDFRRERVLTPNNPVLRDNNKNVTSENILFISKIVSDDTDSDDIDYSSLDYFVLEEAGGKRTLYEKYSFAGDMNEVGSLFRPVPTLGAFGFNEYRPEEVNYDSLIPENKREITNVSTFEFANIVHPKNLLKRLAVVDNSDPFTALQVAKEMLKQKNGTYNALIELMIGTNKLDTVAVRLATPEELNGHKAGYQSSTNTILLNESFYQKETFNARELQNILVEELIHATTKDLLDKYVNIKNVDENGVTYELQEDTPDSMKELLKIYDYAVKKYFSNGKNSEALETLKNILSNRNGDTSSAVFVDTAQEMAGYRFSDLNEFVAGILLRDSNFAKEMAQLPYRNTKKTVLEKIVEKLIHLFTSLFPENARMDSVGVQATNALLNLLKEETDLFEEPASNMPDKGGVNAALNALNQANSKISTEVMQQSKEQPKQIQTEPTEQPSNMVRILPSTKIKIGDDIEESIVYPISYNNTPTRAFIRERKVESAGFDGEGNIVPTIVSVGWEIISDKGETSSKTYDSKESAIENFNNIVVSNQDNKPVMDKLKEGFGIGENLRDVNFFPKGLSDNDINSLTLPCE